MLIYFNSEIKIWIFWSLQIVPIYLRLIRINSIRIKWHLYKYAVEDLGGQGTRTYLWAQNFFIFMNFWEKRVQS